MTLQKAVSKNGNIHPARICYMYNCYYCPLFSGHPWTSWNEGQLNVMKS